MEKVFLSIFLGKKENAEKHLFRSIETIPLILASSYQKYPHSQKIPSLRLSWWPQNIFLAKTT